MKRLSNGTPVGPYRIQRFIKDGVFNSNYVVEDGKDGLFFLKLFDTRAIPEEWLDRGVVREIAISRDLKTPTSYLTSRTGRLSSTGLNTPIWSCSSTTACSCLKS